MKATKLIFATCLFIFVSCNDKEEKPSSVTDADNTRVNVRDRDKETKTPTDQKENKDDIKIAADIRKKVTDTKMSTNAQNIKIVVQDGKVTLRGPVKNQEEKDAVQTIAREVAGDTNVVNQIEVETKP